MYVDSSIFLSLGHTEYFANNTPVVVTRVGSTDANTLNCHTDSTTCCRGMHNPDKSKGFGEWIFPDGSRIAKDSVTGDGFYWVRGYQVVRLYHQGNIQSPLGSYCCRIPDSSGAMRTFCANLVGKT